jgi:hypothetical protein
MGNGAANFGAHAAMENIGGKLRFAAAPNAIVAIIEARSTGADGAHAIGTTRRRIGRCRTRRSARAAIQGIRSGIDFAPVRLKSIAIGESRQTLPKDTRASNARRLGIGCRHALIATTAAMNRIVADVDFAPVRNFSVAISKPLFAVPNGTHGVLATAKCIRGFAFGSARATILPAFSEIDFASIEQRVVAIGKTSAT